MPDSVGEMIVSDAGIKRRFRERSTNSCSVVAVRATGGAGSLTAAVAQAVDDANYANTQPATAGVHGDYLFMSSKDVMFFLVADSPLDGVRDWLEVVRDSLERGGWRGKIFAPSDSWGPEVSWNFRDQHIAWNASIGFTLPRRTTKSVGSWPVRDDVTGDVCSFAREWTAQVHGAKYFGHGASQIKVDQQPPADLLRAALKRSHQLHLTTLGQKPHVMRSASLSFGVAEFSVKGVDEHWRTSISALREALVHFGPAADCGWIAYGLDCIHSLEGKPSYPSGGRRGLLQGEWANNRHLWSSYVPEVFGMQILTAAHLDRANDLRGWKITGLGNDRYLVEAADLEKWYSQPTPYISARGFAHLDFGDMILTEQAIRADPHAWLSGDGARPPTDV